MARRRPENRPRSTGPGPGLGQCNHVQHTSRPRRAGARGSAPPSSALCGPPPGNRRAAGPRTGPGPQAPVPASAATITSSTRPGLGGRGRAVRHHHRPHSAGRRPATGRGRALAGGPPAGRWPGARRPLRPARSLSVARVRRPKRWSRRKQRRRWQRLRRRRVQRRLVHHNAVVYCLRFRQCSLVL